MDFRTRKFSKFKLLLIIFISLVAFFGLMMLINSISTAPYSYQNPIVKKIWWVEFLVGVLCLLSSGVSFIALFYFKKPKIALDFAAEGIVLWPLANVIEVIIVLVYYTASLFALPPFTVIAFLFYIVATVLGIIASIRKIDEDIRKKIGIASFIVSALSIILSFFQSGQASNLAYIINSFYIVMTIFATVFYAMFVYDFEYFYDFYTDLLVKSRNNSTNTEVKTLPTKETNEKNIVERLEMLKNLLDKGYISIEQYEEKKSKIIDEL